MPEKIIEDPVTKHLANLEEIRHQREMKRKLDRLKIKRRQLEVLFFFLFCWLTVFLIANQIKDLF